MMTTATASKPLGSRIQGYHRSAGRSCFCPLLIAGTKLHLIAD
jgi:hypothetical protein